MSPGPADLADLAEVHDELRSVARDLLGRATPLVGDGSAPPPVDWAQLAEMGWLGLEVPEALGGSGATFAEVAVVLQELGRAAAVGPFLGTAVLGVGALNLTVAGPVRDELLAAVAAGSTRFGTVVADGAIDADPAAPFSLRSTGDGGFVLDGRADLVPDVVHADRLLVLALEAGSGADADGPGTAVLVVVDPSAPGITVESQPVLDATRSVGAVVAEGAAIVPERALRFASDPAASVQRLADRAAVAVACDALGSSRAMLDATVAYAGIRHQFGRPIGSFQAVKHACADMLVRVTVADELVRAAIADVAGGAPDASRSASMAKAYATEGGVEVAGSAMQLHGGIGYAGESGVHVYLKRATFDRALFGSPAHHRRRLGARLAAAAPADPPG